MTNSKQMGLVKLKSVLQRIHHFGEVEAYKMGKKTLLATQQIEFTI